MKLLLCALALAATTAKLDSAKITLQTADQDAKDAAIISWDGKQLKIPQHTDQIAVLNDAIGHLQKDITSVNSTLTKKSEALDKLTQTVNGFEARWTAAITTAVQELKVEEIKKTAEKGVEDAADALKEAEHALEIAEDNIEDIANVTKQIENNAVEIQQNEDNVAANAENIATNEQNIKGKACRTGTYRNPTNGAECIRCPRGQWADQVGTLACKGSKCAKGKYNPHDAATNQFAARCLTCQSGKYTDALASAICKGTVCAAGTWHPEGQTKAHTCHDCAKGRYNIQTGRAHISYCKPCRTGTSSNKLAATLASDCESCSKGRYADQWGLAVCKACGKGRFNDLTARWSVSQCKACGAGRYGDQTARTMSSQCKACASGTYNPNSVRTSPCASCTHTGSCPYGKVKREGKSCTSTQNQVCVTKWDSWSSNTQCHYPGQSTSCANAERTCESHAKCYGIQQRNYKTESCTGGGWYWKSCSWSCWGFCCGWKTKAKTCTTQWNTECNVCTYKDYRGEYRYNGNGEYKVRDYNKW